MAARLVAYASCEDTGEREAPRPSVSAIGRMARLRLIPACAMASASIRSFFAVTGSMPRAASIDLPGRYPTSVPLARHLRTTSEPMLFFWSTTASAPLPASSSRASTSCCRFSTRLLIRISPSGSSPTAQWKDLPASTPR